MFALNVVAWAVIGASISSGNNDLVPLLYTVFALSIFSLIGLPIVALTWVVWRRGRRA